MKLPTSTRIECRVTECKWAHDLPVEFRIVRHPDAPVPGGFVLVGATVEVDDAAVAAFDELLAHHLDEHATDGAPPATVPPSWPEVEWCDDGGSCEHDSCMRAVLAEIEAEA